MISVRFMKYCLVSMCWLITMLYAQDGQDPVEGQADAAVSAERKIRIDRFGQLNDADWLGKVHDESELRQDAVDDAAYYASLELPARDTYGGYLGTKEKYDLQATGFFHLERIGERHVLVTPQGNAFYSLGVGGLFSYHDWLPYNEEVTDLFEWLPPTKGAFQHAFMSHNRYVSFYVINWIRKYGSYNSQAWKKTFAERLKRWGFNTHNAYGRFSSTSNFAEIPMTIVVRVYGGKNRIIPKTDLFDIFDAESRELVKREMAEVITPYAEEPMIIGYYLHNEPKFYELINGIVPLTGDWPVKQRLVAWLEEKYQTPQQFSHAWDWPIEQFSDLLVPLELKTSAAKSDMEAFRVYYLETYFKFMHDTFRECDANHLILGYRFRWADSRDLTVNRVIAPYVDIISDNYYGTGEFDRSFLQRSYDVSHRPRLLSEWSYDADDCGLPGYIRHVDSELIRGKAFRHYQEQAASLPFIIGTQWWCMLDHQRWSLNTGLVNVADRPYKLFLQWVRQANLNVASIMFEGQEPFSTPKFKALLRQDHDDYGTNNWYLIEVP